MNTVIIPVRTKIAVAIIEFTDSLPIPHIPWPEVHPPPSLVPKPTKKPPEMISRYELVFQMLLVYLAKLDSR